ncbi:hypothetical protein ACUH7Y_01950 [Clostridium beijerinckii]|uniref:Uncharacterized protein n=1 Tax=Clostridium beijerinckii TaxID=1520 RepID=A0A1W7LLG5_CLOBE|nr:hypothetical protein [Clostridium beijerinckii]MBA8937783.1 hypothetical protein [Clostridium beijerinckii]NMF07586.1 hypothetical protein [Clostridium beijerinckii]NOW07277.1 hypothetical protein [Clostridium beijerinckii]NRT32698.1 hypothetical protein [Clostridium beijerinckii]NRT47874.1 hypothetical protein [Clostridium beijerinckii]
MHKSKRECRTQESRRINCSYIPIPDCEREILLILTVILFILNNDSKRIWNRCYSGSHKKKDDTTKNDIDLSKLYEDIFDKNNIKRYDKCQNENSKIKDNRMKNNNASTNKIYENLSDENSIKRHDKCYDESNKIKDDTIEPNIDYSEMNETSLGGNITKKYDKSRSKSRREKEEVIKSDNVQNEAREHLTQEEHYRYSESNSIQVLKSNNEKPEKITKANNLEQYGDINPNKEDKEIGDVSLLVTIDKHSEEISVQNNIQSEKNSNLLNNYTEEKCNKMPISLGTILKNYYRGAMVSAMLPNGIVVSGEVAFNFNHIVALKYNNIIIFINEDHIISFH